MDGGISNSNQSIQVNPMHVSSPVDTMKPRSGTILEHSGEDQLEEDKGTGVACANSPETEFSRDIVTVAHLQVRESQNGNCQTVACRLALLFRVR
jgi:hypothetical protein